MKRILTNFLNLAGIALVMLSSCKKNDPVITSDGGKPGALTSDQTTLVLDRTKLSDTSKVINFSFTAPVYDFNAAVSNTIQIDAMGDNWANPASATLSGKVYKQGYSTLDFNSLLLKLKLPGGVASKVQVRVQHALSTTVASYSNVLTLTVTPFNLTSWIYVAGAFQGWNAAAPDSLISATGNSIYTGIINFTAGNNQFLILPEKNFNNKYATNDPQGTTSSTVTYNAPNNLYAPAAAGQYIVTLDLNKNTITFAQPNVYSVIGTVTPGGDFSTDIDLNGKYINDGVTGWTGIVPMTGTFPGTFKIRQNHDWGNSWGDVNPPDGVDLTSNSGGNINVASAGTYKVTFNIALTPLGAPPAQNATYTLTKQ